uniref:SH3 domain-containing protein n=1 Tax=Mesocestoides corti TaxID=53468 RepID=A0A5K3FBC4_MESCO
MSKMGSRSWGVELWDQMDYLLQHENDQFSIYDHHVRLLCELQKLFVDFGKKYRKTVANYIPKKKSVSTFDTKLTYKSVLADSVTSFLDFGTSFENYGAELLKSVITPLKSEYDRERKVADKVIADYARHSNHREREKKRLEDTWRAHVNALKEKQKAETVSTLAQSDPNISQEERLKAQSNLSIKNDAFVATQQTYAAEMREFNDNQRHYFTHSLCTLIAELEMLDRQRSKMTQELLLKCSDLSESLSKQLSDSAQSLRNTVSRIDPEADCRAVLEARKTDYHFPVDLPFLNLAQCTQATLENQSALVNLMLGTSNGFAAKGNAEKVSKGIHNLFGKSKTQTSDGNVLQTPFIAGIGYKPVKETDMTVIQLNDRIKTLKDNLDKVTRAITATQRLLDSYVQNPSLGNQRESEETIAKLQRQTFSLSELISKLESRYTSMGGDKALADAQSSLECTNPYAISNPTDKPLRPTSMPKRDTLSE